MRTKWDIIIAGAGPAGLACATLLLQNGWRVLLAEARIAAAPRPVETLCPRAVGEMKSIFQCAEPPPEIAIPCNGVASMWEHDAAEPTVTDYRLIHRVPGLAVRRPLFEQWLAKSIGSLDLRIGWRFAGHVVRNGAAVAQFETGEGIVEAVAQKVIDATGRRISHRQVGVRQLAVWMNLPETDTDIAGFLLVERTASGWWYLQAVPGGGAQIVFVTATPMQTKARVLSEELARRFSECVFLRKYVKHIPRGVIVHAADARLVSIATSADEMRIPVGDAAGTTDPLAGRGWLRALTSAKALAAAVSHSLSAGDEEPIRAYLTESVRAADAHRMMLGRFHAMSPTIYKNHYEPSH